MFNYNLFLSYFWWQIRNEWSLLFRNRKKQNHIK